MPDKIDGRIIGDGKPGIITKKITALFQAEVRRDPQQK
jgi:hypothetical protein